MRRSEKRFGRLAATLLGVLVGPVGASAEPAGVWWEKTPPSIEEISGGKLHVGDRITKDNVENVKDYMPEAFYRDTLNGAEWEISPTTAGDRLVIPDMVAATKANLGKAVVDQAGTVVTADGKPWIGGFPFPEPKTGLEVMVNRQFKSLDGHFDYWKSYWVNANGETYKNTIGNVMAMNTTARVCQEPKPYMPGYENQLSRELVLFLDPYDVKGLSVLTAIYVDQTRYPDAWGYIPVLRRVQRFSSGQRYDSIDGSDLRAGDLDAFSDPLGIWEFKLLGRKPMFAVLTGAQTQSGAIPVEQDHPLLNGRYPQGARVELRDTYVVEAVPKDSTHIYSRKVLFLDAATFWSWLGQFYDRQGELWMGYSLWFRGLSNECGNFPAATWVSIQNYQTGSATLFSLEHYWRNPGLSMMYPEMFTLKYIMGQGR